MCFVRGLFFAKKPVSWDAMPYALANADPYQYMNLITYHHTLESYVAQYTGRQFDYFIYVVDWCNQGAGHLFLGNDQP